VTRNKVVSISVFRSMQIIKIKFNEGGQSLIEILIAMGIVGFFIGGAVLSAQLALRLSAQNKNLQAAAFLAQELLDNFTVVGERDWHRVDMYGGDALAESPAQYFIDISVTPFVISPSSESVVVDGITYTRYLVFLKASRGVGEAIEAVYSSANEDPGTLRVVANVEWGAGSKVDITKFVTRSKNSKNAQTDWAGGNGQSGVVGDPGKYDAADAGIDVTGKKGAIRLNGITY